MVNTSWQAKPKKLPGDMSGCTLIRAKSRAIFKANIYCRQDYTKNYNVYTHPKTKVLVFPCKHDVLKLL